LAAVVAQQDVFWLAAALLAAERICYGWIWLRPGAFRAALRSLPGGAHLDPTSAVLALCSGFKVVQAGVFAAWCLVFGQAAGWPDNRGSVAGLLGALLLVAGQTLNVSVFLRLGRIGVFYGDRLGHRTAWRDEFPFSWLDHPQYVGVVASIWGVFAILRHPHEDWMILPLLETIYYGISACVEKTSPAAAAARSDRASGARSARDP
jgi:methylene-fatty-acyl-phospholipid synthase